MLFLTFVYHFIQGASFDISSVPFIDKRSLESNPCTNLMHCQTIWNIIWSCHITIFSYTWVAIHPTNIPCPRKRKVNSCIKSWLWNPLLSFAKHHLQLFICALLVLEYILAWVIRQFLRAQMIVNQNKGELDALD